MGTLPGIEGKLREVTSAKKSRGIGRAERGKSLLADSFGSLRRDFQARQARLTMRQTPASPESRMEGEMFLESMIPGGISRRELRRAIVQVFKRRGESKRVENTRCSSNALARRLAQGDEKGGWGSPEDNMQLHGHFCMWLESPRRCRRLRKT